MTLIVEMGRSPTVTLALDVGLEIARHKLLQDCPWRPESGDLGPFADVSRCLLIGVAASLCQDCDIPAVVRTT